MTSLQNETTTLGAAFAAAGYISIEDRLASLMRQAIEAKSGITLPTLAEFDRLLGDEEEAGLTRALIGAESMHSAALRLFMKILDEMRLERNGRPGQSPRAAAGGQKATAAPASPMQREEAMQRAPTDVGHRPTASPAAPYRPSNARRNVANAILSRILIDGAPLGECTAGYARSWAKKRGIEARFVLRLCNGLQDMMRIGDHVTEEQAAIEYAKAEAEANV
jgi:hypothetical protein